MQPIENPYVSPQEVSAAAPAKLTNRQIVKNRLYQPAIVMILCGVVAAPWWLYQTLMYVVWLNRRIPYDYENRGADILALSFLSLMLFGCLMSIYGGIQLLNVRRYRDCLIAAIFMTIPCISPVILLGLVIGGWTLVALLRKDTRAAFAEGKQR